MYLKKIFWLQKEVRQKYIYFTALHVRNHFLQNFHDQSISFHTNFLLLPPTFSLTASDSLFCWLGKIIFCSVTDFLKMSHVCMFLIIKKKQTRLVEHIIVLLQFWKYTVFFECVWCKELFSFIFHDDHSIVSWWCWW